ncbi:MAG TPA: ribonuclease HI [Candidatus Protoclostridium stercorigallinarum]|uniref:Ribonuclease H n=1 Tax=Candidatus Protoclostridium stercorigallinarum TaxID=2838741 RepID=A0A9D1TRK2_9FIRM|nr:ribonuclease HI [Candidatus Protoclostridium stercorigallinarum]
MKEVILYTDGACSGNPGVGGWGAILMYGDARLEMSGGAAYTTNNKMELTGVIEGLKRLKEPCIVHVYSDSAYVVNAFLQNWIAGWERREWKNVKNPELWHELIALTKMHKVTFHKVKGHSDNEYNNRCDELARGEIVKSQDKRDKTSSDGIK